MSLMRIDQLKLQNFRGFEQFTLDLHPAFTLLLGRNGAGKTAVLDALTIGLAEWLVGLHQARSPERFLRDTDARRIQHERDGVPSIESAWPVVVTTCGELSGGRLVEWSESQHRKGGLVSGSGMEPVHGAAWMAGDRVSAGDDVDLPVLAYYGTSRLWPTEARPERDPDRLMSRMHGYDGCLDPRSSSWRFEEWMKWREQARIERIAGALDAGQPPMADQEPGVVAVQEAAASCLPGARKVSYSLNERRLMVTLDDARTLPFHLLSDGYRAVVELAADLAWRAVQLNPHLGADAPRRVRGIVLIDEIDLHLHPRWQRSVIGDLRRTFPGIQFVATTHSPQVLSTAQSEWVRLLVPGENGARRVGPVTGRDTNSLLEDIFGEPARPQHEHEQLEELGRLIDDGQLDEAHALLEKLKVTPGADDPDVVRAEWMLRDLEDERRVEDLEGR